MKPSIRSAARLSFSLATAIAALLSASSASAQDGTWLGATGNWNATGTWSGGVIADGVGFTANFTGANLTANQTITLGADRTIGNITFTDATTSSNDLVISGANTLTLAVASGSPVINVTQADPRLLSISSVVAGTQGLTKSGTGVLSLSGTNTYSGVTNVTAGRLAVSSLGGLGSTSAITLGGTSAATLSSGVNSLTITAPITTANSGINSSFAFGMNSNAAGTFNLNGAIGGSGNVIFTTVGTSNNNLQSINLGAAGTHTGTTTITTGLNTNSNTVKNTSGAANVLPTTTVLGFSNIDALGSGRTTSYDLNGQDQTLAGLSFTGALGVRRFFNVNNTGAPATLTINNASDYSFGAATNANSTVSPFPLVQANARIMGAIALTKNGSGTLSLGGTLSGGATVNAHPYTGATNILGGTLRLFSGGAITASSGITINGSTAKLLQENTVTAIAPSVTLTQGTLTGSGTVDIVNVGDATGGIISNNNGTAGATLTIGALTFSGAATVNTFSNSASAPIVTTSLATNVAGTVTLNPTSATWAAGTYDLISYGGGTIGGAGFSQFALGTVTGASPRQSKVLGDSGTAITLTVGADDSPYWAGDGDATWNTTSVNNWKLNSNNSPTTFLALDNALFNDNATGAGPLTVNIDAANVSPTSTTFDNSTKNYVVNSSSTFGIATGFLTKSGTGSLTLNTVNTYTGNTTITAGTLIMGAAGQLGGGNYAGAIANDGSFQYSSSANQTLSGVISGTGSIIQNGSGNLTLTSANTFAGGLKIKGGTVILSNNAAAGTGTIEFDTGAVTNASVQFTGAVTSVANPVTVIAGSAGTNTISSLGTGALVLSGSIAVDAGTTLTLDNSSSSNSTLDVGTGLITGSGSITTTGTSTNSFVFRGANTYSGGTTLGGSGVYIPATSSTGSGLGTTDGPFGTGTLTLGTISMRSTTLADITVGNSLILAGDLTVPTAGSEKTLAFMGPVTLTGNRTITSQVVATGKSLNLSGVIGDGGNNYGITKEGAGVLLLAAANTYAGATTVNAGTLSITHDAALGSTTGATTVNGGNGTNSVILSLSGATSDLTITEPLNFLGSVTGRARLSNSSAQNHILSGPIDVTSDTNLTQFYSDGTGSVTVSGDITGTMTNGAVFALRGSSANPLNRVTGSISLVGDISKTDGGTWQLGGPGETYSWTNTVVAFGTLKMGLANVLPATTVVNFGNPTGSTNPILDLNGFNQTVAGIIYNGQGVTTGTRTITSATPAVLTVNNASDSITTGTNVSTNNVVLTGALSLIKQGAGTLALNGVNAYSGDTTVNEGILSLTKAASALDANTGNDTSTVTIAATAGATLDLAYTGTDEVDKLFIGGVQKAAGVWGSSTSGAPNIDAKLTGSGTLTVASGPSTGYTSWAATNAGGETADLDFDKDGVSNGVEFFMNAPAGITVNPQLNGSNSITWQNGGNIPASAYGTQFVIQTSSNLSTWTDVLVGDLTTNTDGPGGSVTYTLTGVSPRFVRMKVIPN